MTVTTPIWSTTPVEALPRLAVDGRDTGLPLWTARTRRERNKGLLGTDGIDGALWITRCNWVHCLGMRHTIDVVYLTRRDKVAAVTPLRPGRIGMPNLRAAAVLEMAQGEAARLAAWNRAGKSGWACAVVWPPPQQGRSKPPRWTGASTGHAFMDLQAPLTARWVHETR